MYFSILKAIKAGIATTSEQTKTKEKMTEFILVYINETNENYLEQKKGKENFDSQFIKNIKTKMV